MIARDADYKEDDDERSELNTARLSAQERNRRDRLMTHDDHGNAAANHLKGDKEDFLKRERS